MNHQLLPVHIFSCGIPNKLLNKYCFLFSEITEAVASMENSISQKVKLTLEKAMAPHCSTLAWKIPWMEEPGRLQSMGARPAVEYQADERARVARLSWRVSGR